MDIDNTASSVAPLDRIVIETRDATHLQTSLWFWKDNFGFESSQSTALAARAEKVEATSQLSGLSLSSRKILATVRLSDSSVIDLVAAVEKPTERKKKRKTSVVDHLVIELSGSEVVDTLANFVRNGISVAKISGGYDEREWGDKRGRYISVHFQEPNGIWCEMRTHEVAYLVPIREGALPCVHAYLKIVMNQG